MNLSGTGVEWTDPSQSLITIRVFSILRTPCLLIPIDAFYYLSKFGELGDDRNKRKSLGDECTPLDWIRE